MKTTMVLVIRVTLDDAGSEEGTTLPSREAVERAVMETLDDSAEGCIRFAAFELVR